MRQTILLAALALPLLSCKRQPPSPPRAVALTFEQPVNRFTPRLSDGRRLSVAKHFGSPYPIRQALTVGDHVWLATPTGVLRFDERLLSEPENARPIGQIAVAEGLPSASINRLLRLADGRIAIATDAGLVYADSQGKLLGGISLPGERIMAVTAEFVGTWRGLFERGSGRRVPKTSALRVTALVRRGATTYVGTHLRGLFSLDARGLRPVKTLGRTRISALIASRSSEDIWAATISGLFFIDQRGQRPLHLASRHVTTIATDASSLLIGTFGEGMLRYVDGQVQTIIPRGRVSFIFAAAPGRWLVGVEDALWLVDHRLRKWRVPLSGPPRGLISALAIDGETLWAGGFDSGLERKDRDDRFQRWSIFESRITALAVAEVGDLWVGTASGLGRRVGAQIVRVIDPEGWLSGRHISTLRYHRGRLWVGVHPGLVAIDVDQPLRFAYFGAKGRAQSATLIGDTVYGLACRGAAAKPTCWVGTQTGLSLFAPGAKVTASLTDLSGLLPDNWINDVRADKEATFVLSLRSGILRLGPRRLDVIKTNLMTSPSVLQVIGGAMVFGTNAHGLVVIKREEGGYRRASRHASAQGVASRLIAALAYDRARDRLWIGGDAGIERLDSASRRLGLSRASPKALAAKERHK